MTYFHAACLAVGAVSVVLLSISTALIVGERKTTAWANATCCELCDDYDGGSHVAA